MGKRNARGSALPAIAIQAARYAAEQLEPRVLLSGVTIITHGFNSGATQGKWPDAMGDAIANRLGGERAVAQFTLKITRSGQPTGYSYLRDPNTPVWGGADNPSGELIIKLDWSELDGPLLPVPTGTVADAAADILLRSPIDGRSIFEVPVHLIGHSRGSSLMNQLAKDLGTNGLWVDQLTTLDPHPVDGIREPGDTLVNYHDAPMNLWDNIVFADNFWHQADPNNPLDFTGETVDGANNYGPLVLPDGANPIVGGGDHTDVHSYYAGTIARNAIDDGAGDPIVNAWYGGDAVRASTGFNRSRIGGGTILGGIGPVAGGTSYRAHADASGSDRWTANIGSLSLAGGNAGLIANGDAIDLGFRYENELGGGQVRFYFDDDTNPYNNTSSHPLGGPAGLSVTGPTPNTASGTVPVTWSSTGLDNGLYRIYATITNQSGRTRFAYLPQPLYVTAGGAEVITKQWTGDVSSDWSDPRNWTPGGVPTGNDRTTIQLSPIHHVDVKAGTEVAGTLHLLSGTMNWVGGNLQGVLTISPAAVLSIFGYGERVITNGASLVNAGRIVQGDAAILRLQGFGPNITSSIRNLSGGVYDLQGNGGIEVATNYPYRYHAISNAGTFRKIGSNGTATIAVPFTNVGTVEVRSGTLEFEGPAHNRESATFDNAGTARVSPGARLALKAGGRSAGTFDMAAGGTTTLAGGILTLDIGAAFTGDGYTAVVGAITVNGVVMSEDFRLVAGADLGGNHTILGNFVWTGGNLTGRTLNAQGAHLRISGEEEKVIANGATLQNAGTVTQLGGAVVRLQGFGPNIPSRLDNLTGGVYDLQGEGGIQAATNYAYRYHAATNAGIFRKLGGIGTSAVSVPFTNSGTLEVRNGTLEFEGPVYNREAAKFENAGFARVSSGATLALKAGGGGGGTFEMAAGGVTTLAGGTVTFDPGAAFTGDGYAAVVGATIVNGPFTGQDIRLVAGGDLGGDHTIAGNFAWTGGNLTGRTLIAAGAHLTISGQADKVITNGSTLQNAGTATQAGESVILLQGFGPSIAARLDNLAGGVYDLQGDGGIKVATNYPYRYHSASNAGIFRKLGGTGTSSVAVPFTNSGTVEIRSGTLAFSDSCVQIGGQTLLNGGSLTSISPLQIQGGHLTGLGIVVSRVDNGGSMRPGLSPGLLTIEGDYTQPAGGLLEAEIGGPVVGIGYDQLSVKGVVSLAGPLAITLSYAPAEGEVFRILQNDGTDAVAGTFAGLPEGAVFAVGGQQFRISYTGGTGNDVVLTAIGPVLPPPQVVGMTVNGGAAQRSRVDTIAVRFDRAVVLDAGAVEVARRAAGGPLAIAVAASSADGGLTYVLTFGGPGTAGGAVADGVYDLRVRAAGARAAGMAMAADYAFAFHRLYSDADGDGDSDNADLFQFRGSYGRSVGDPAYKSYFDFDGDGDVDNADLFQVRSRRGVEYKGY